MTKCPNEQSQRKSQAPSVQAPENIQVPRPLQEECCRKYAKGRQIGAAGPLLPASARFCPLGCGQGDRRISSAELEIQTAENRAGNGARNPPLPALVRQGPPLPAFL